MHSLPRPIELWLTPFLVISLALMCSMLVEACEDCEARENHIRGASQFDLKLNSEGVVVGRIGGFGDLDESENGGDDDGGGGGRIVCRVVEYGAVGNGKFLNTPFIQAAIDSCARKGGGVVYFAPGLYLTGTIVVKSNVTLYVAEGATILGSSEQEDFPLDAARWYTILAENAQNVGLTGGGVIDGQGLKFVITFDESKNVMVSWNQTGACEGKACRPRLVGIYNSTDVHVSNLEFRNPPLWCLHINLSNIVTVQNISIFGDFNSPSNDGIDIDSSNNTIVQDCHIDTADDGIVPKTTSGPLHNLTVNRCWVRSKSSAVKLGSESRFDFCNIVFDNLTISESHRGLGIQLRDSGNIRNITFSNIVMDTRYYDPSWWGNGEPIYVTACPREIFTEVGCISGVQFINISITTENGIFLAGSPACQLQGVEFHKVSMKFASSTNFTGGYHDYRPGCQELIPHHMSGIFMEHVASAKLQDVVLHWDKNLLTKNWGLPLEFTPATVSMLEIKDFQTVQIKSASTEVLSHTYDL